MFTSEDKAAILVDALPYIQEFYGKTVVIKYGGNAMVSDDLKEKVMEDIALLKYVGVRPVIIHGGGPEITGFLKKVGKETNFVSGLRVTDEETVEIAEMVLDGKVNSEIVNLLNHRGVKAVGISGKDAGLIRAKKKLATVYDGDDAKKVDIGYVGEVEKVDTSLLDDLIDHDYIPVIAPIGVDEEGASYNINADYVAAEIAGALHYELPSLSRLIRQKTGKNYTELLQEKRLSQAAWLLRNTDKNVDEIANAVGYENLSYFHRLFAARYCLSPKKYRDCK